jgi:2,4-dienoyl-CoA reductase-like NADH-dependent reductase (Old Yellow Enzyme family)
VKHEYLFSPITMRGVTFPNRIQRTSMVSGHSIEDGRVTNESKKRYQWEMILLILKMDNFLGR